MARRIGSEPGARDRLRPLIDGNQQNDEQKQLYLPPHITNSPLVVRGSRSAKTRINVTF